MSLEAESREAVFKELAERGITAIRIEQSAGKNRKLTAANKRMAGSPSPVRGIVAAVIVAAAAFVALRFLSQKQEEVIPDAKPRKQSKIEAVPPAPAVPPKVEQPKPEPVQMVTNRHGKVVQRKKPETYVDAAGVERYVKGNGRVPLKNPEKYLVKSVVHPNAYPDFKHDSENEIANLLTIENGGMIFGDREYDKRFEQDFLQALMEPVEINEDDSENDRLIKENVEAAKKEIA